MENDAWSKIIDRLRRLGIFESDLKEHFVRSGGKGGQNVNKVATCVVLSHTRSGISVRCEEERSQSQNRFAARVRLADQMEKRKRTQESLRQQAREKEKRQKRKRNRKAKEQILRDKHHRGRVKKGRQQGSWDE